MRGRTVLASLGCWLTRQHLPHARSVPAGASATDADIQFAANLSSWFSKLRNDGKVEVTLVEDPRKSISKAPHGKPGQVMVRPGRERTVLGRPDQSAAARGGGAAEA